VDVVLSKIYMNSAIKGEAADLFYIKNKKKGFKDQDSVN
jgi:hypothetical protein